MIAALGKSWLIKEYDCNDKDTVRMPRQDLLGMMKSLKSSHKPRF